eukprot:350447-Chlamydomonas_euryale.AAC.1
MCSTAAAAHPQRMRTAARHGKPTPSTTHIHSTPWPAAHTPHPAHLAPRAPAQLVVNAARLVALGSDHVQASERYDLGLLGVSDRLVLCQHGLHGAGQESRGVGKGSGAEGYREVAACGLPCTLPAWPAWHKVAGGSRGGGVDVWTRGRVDSVRWERVCLQRAERGGAGQSRSQME